MPKRHISHTYWFLIVFIAQRPRLEQNSCVLLGLKYFVLPWLSTTLPPTKAASQFGFTCGGVETGVLDTRWDSALQVGAFLLCCSVTMVL